MDVAAFENPREPQPEGWSPPGAPPFDLYDPSTLERGVPHDVFDWMRREAPVFWHPEPEGAGAGFWCVTRHADVRTVSRDNETYSAERGGAFVETWDEEQLQLARLTLLNMDPPRHTRNRLLVNKGFTPRMIGRLESHIHDITTSILDAVIDKGEADFVDEIAAELPLQVICEMMGVPHADRRLVFEWSNRLVGFDDPDFQSSPEDGQMASAEMWAYCQQLVDERRREPRDDIMTALVQAEIDGERLSDDELNMFFVILCIAGNETTRNLIAHGMLALIEHPDQRAELAADPSLLPSAVEEMLRWNPSIAVFRRTATRDTVLRGVEIAEGDKVTMWYPSANRDEDVFVDPHTFDIRREPNDHLSFGGGGIHYCLGANLARLEIRVILGEVLSRMPDLELAGDVARMRSRFINGIKRMPVRWTP